MTISFILTNPARPENIGAAARALKTMGFTDLRLVNPADHLGEQARRLAHGANDILETARGFKSLPDAIAGYDLVIGTSAKQKHSHQDYYPPGKLPELIISKKIETVAVVFGSEERGLSKAELGLCHLVSSIPLAEPYPSLNLAQAVMVYAYTLAPLGLEISPNQVSEIAPAEWATLRNKTAALLDKLNIEEGSQLHGRIIERLSALGTTDIHLLLSILGRIEQKIYSASPAISAVKMNKLGLTMEFHKYQALGNDYIVIDPRQLKVDLTPGQIIRICHPHLGVGSDGILVGPYPSSTGDFGLRLFNPDGGEFEKSGNGLRIFCRYLWDRNLVGAEEFTIDTPGGLVRAMVFENGRRVKVEMGQISFDSTRIPVAGPPREVLNEIMNVNGTDYHYCAVTIGNPHCVVIPEQVSVELAHSVGPVFETAPRFPNRTNVQFLEIIDRNNIHIEIWERGVGYTLASGSSSCAAASVAHKLGHCDNSITVHCAGGDIEIEIGDDYYITMTGAVTKVCSGLLADEVFD